MRQIQHFWIFWPITLLLYHLFKIGQALFWTMVSSYIYGALGKKAFWWTLKRWKRKRGAGWLTLYFLVWRVCSTREFDLIRWLSGLGVVKFWVVQRIEVMRHLIRASPNWCSILKTCRYKIYDACHEKIDLRVFVVVILKEGWARYDFLEFESIPRDGWAWPHAAILHLVWQRQRP